MKARKLINRAHTSTTRSPYTVERMTTSPVIRLLSLAIGLSLLVGMPAIAAVSITEVQAHTFPAAMTDKQTARLTVNQYGQLEGVQGATVLGDYYSAGHYLLQSDSSSPITINITSLEDVPNVSLGSIELLYQGRTYRKFPARRLPNPGTGSTAQIGIKITFSRDVPPGAATPSFTIDVTEDSP